MLENPAVRRPVPATTCYLVARPPRYPRPNGVIFFLEGPLLQDIAVPLNLSIPNTKLPGSHLKKRKQFSSGFPNQTFEEPRTTLTAVQTEPAPLLFHTNHPHPQQKCLLSRPVIASPKTSSLAGSVPRPKTPTSTRAASLPSSPPAPSSRTKRSSSSPSPAPSPPPAPPTTSPATSARRPSSRPRASTRSSSLPATTPGLCPPGARLKRSMTSSSSLPRTRTASSARALAGWPRPPAPAATPLSLITARSPMPSWSPLAASPSLVPTRSSPSCKGLQLDRHSPQ